MWYLKYRHVVWCDALAINELYYTFASYGFRYSKVMFFYKFMTYKSETIEIMRVLVII